MILRYPILLAMLLLAAACSTPNAEKESLPAVEPGVSLSLAQWRKAHISQLHYSISLQIPDSALADILAESVIRFRLDDRNRPLLLDFKPDSSHIRSVSVNGDSVAISWQSEHLLIDPANLAEGDNEIRVSFHAGNEALTRKPGFLYTLFVPERARTFMPCFDQPDLKAVFRVEARLPATWQMVTNGNLRDSSVEGSKKWLRFADSDTIPSYLFSVVAGRFNTATRTVAGRPFTLYYRETDTARINFSLDSIFAWHERSLRFLENYTGMAFPYQKMDAVAIPDFQYGGMEHVGAIDYKEASLFLDRTATESQRRGRARLIAHETAHMWFGNLVTMRWFNDVWMKEVFANFMADKITQEAMPTGQDDFSFFLQHYPAAYGVDRTEGTNPVRQSLDNLNNAGSMYGAIIYDKAPIVMQMLESMMGPQAFQRGVQAYMRRYAQGNADWPELIALLDEETGEDLQRWNETWINTPGRPVLDYTLEQADGRISKLILRQQSENGQYGVWPQVFDIALFGSDSTRYIRVDMRDATLAIKEVEGLPVPDFMLFNARGTGYGLFPVDTAMLRHMPRLESPMLRATACNNLYENMLAGRDVRPGTLLSLLDTLLVKETEQLLVNNLVSQYQSCFWNYHTDSERNGLAARAEQSTWRAMQQAAQPGIRRSIFNLYQGIASTPAAADSLYHMWRLQKGPAGMALNEADLTSLAATLAILQHSKATEVLEQQAKRITNEDRKARFRYLRQPLSNDTAVRDAYFASLAQKENRSNEEWISIALGYLHHPLRRKESEKYLPATLRLLEEVRSTGGVFFPTTWVSAALGRYQTASAEKTVRDFLATRPDYNANLRLKILQAADPLFRANRICGVAAEKN